MERRQVAVGLAGIAALAIAVPAIAGSDAGISVSKKIKKAIKKEVARQVEPPVPGPQGPPGEDGARGPRGLVGPRGPSNATIDSISGPIPAPNTLSPLDPDADVPAGATSMFFAKLEWNDAGDPAGSQVQCDLVLDVPGAGPDILLDRTATLGPAPVLEVRSLSLLGGGTNPSATENASAEIQCTDADTGVDLRNIKLGVIRVGALAS